MKIISAILLSLAIIKNCQGQEKFYNTMPMENSKVVYTEIVSADSVNKDILFAKIKDWAVNNYASQKATLQADDRETGYLAYKGFMVVLDGSKKANVMLYHTLKFYIKDGKFKIVFDDLYTCDPMIEALFGSAEKVPIERWGIDKNGNIIKKKLEKNTKDINSFDKSIGNLFESIKNSALNNKSAFDF